MLTQQVQEKRQRQLTFEQICPLWYESFKTGVLNKKLDALDGRFCIIGEAHGFKDSKYNGCPECYQFSFGGYFNKSIEFSLSSYWCVRNNSKDRAAFEQKLDKFVKHWNECHVVESTT